VHPFAKAVRRSNFVSGLVPAYAGSDEPTGITLPVVERYRPTATSVKMLTTKKYVGTAKICPDSRMPRRFPTVSSPRKRRHNSTR
jgi:hypothetical protein